VTIDDVSAEIVRAFPPRVMNFDTAFVNYGSAYLDAETFKAGATGRDWKSLPAAFLERHHDVLLSLDPALFAQLLPALLLALVQDAPEIDKLPYFVIPELRRPASAAEQPRFDAWAGALTSAQKSAVGHALELLLEDARGPERERLEAALNSYWQSGEG